MRMKKQHKAMNMAMMSRIDVATTCHLELKEGMSLYSYCHTAGFMKLLNGHGHGHGQRAVR
jgi:hypothetical protein